MFMFLYLFEIIMIMDRHETKLKVSNNIFIMNNVCFQIFAVNILYNNL
jgi:hypothetical protein